MNPLADLLFRLIEVPSPNPPGDNRAVAQFVADWLAQTGAQVQQLAPPQKPEAVSVVARIGQGHPVIMLHAHADTVPVAESEAQLWTSPPFSPELRNGRIYGKGSVDDKGPLAAMMMAFAQLARSPQPQLQGTLLLVAAAEEEVGGQLGTHWLAEAGHLPALDFAVVGEQTENRVATAHKGVMRATITATGASAHAANPNLGINAISAMARVVLALEAYHQQLANRLHPLVGFPTCNVGVIEGGSTANAVPDFCQIRLDRRMIPGEDPATVQQELEAVVRSVDAGQAQLEIGQYLYSSWFESGLRSPLGSSFLNWVSQVTQTPAEPVGYLPGSDAKHLMPLIRGDMVVFGPGHFSVTHAANEYVELASLETCRQILAGFLEQALLPKGSITASSRS